MSWKITLVCCLMVAVIPGPGITLSLFSWLPGYQGLFGGQDVASRTSSPTGIISGARQAVDTIAGVKSQALNTVVNATKQAMDFGASLAAPIPVVGTAVGLGTDVVKAGADVLNSVGQAKISFFQRLKNAKLNKLEQLFGGSSTVRPSTTVAANLITSPSTIATTTRSTTTMATSPTITAAPTVPTTRATPTAAPTVSTTTATPTVSTTIATAITAVPTASTTTASTTTAVPTVSTTTATTTTVVPSTTTSATTAPTTTASNTTPTTAGTPSTTLATAATSATATAAPTPAP